MNLEIIKNKLEIYRKRAPNSYNKIADVTSSFYLFHQKLFTSTGNILENKYRLGHAEIDVLWTLYVSDTEENILTPTKIKENLFFTGGAITNILKKMEIRNFITRSQDQYDKRIKYVQLTKDGKEIFEKAMSEILLQEEKIFSILDEQEKEQFEKTLNKLLI